jgi:UDP-N-acetylglucosamine--dolichyl-phosphate N-acetylglucosaminephosphotransferase
MSYAQILSLLSFVLALAIVYLAMPRVIAKLEREGITGRDMLKREEHRVPESGGIIIILAVVTSLSIATYLFTTYGYSGDGADLPGKATMQVWMLASIATLLAVGFIGLVDDYLSIPQKYKVLLPAFAALPLALAFFDKTEFYRTDFWIPFYGYLPLGILYPLVLIPVGITAAANLTNMYAGLNGLEIGSGLIACSSTCIAAALIGRWEAVIILAPMVGALLAFLAYNRYPARAFPGDVGTLAIGTSLALASIVGRIKIIAVIALAPHIINFLMYLPKTRYFARNPQSKFASVREDGTLKAPEEGEYGSLYFLLMHLFRRSERWHVMVNWGLCLASGLLAIAIGIIVHSPKGA